MKKWLHLIFCCVCFYSGAIYAESLSLAKEKLPFDGHIRIYVYHTDTFQEFHYLDENRQWKPQVYNEINHLLRSYSDDKIHPVDKRLIELADHLQDHFDVDTIEVISGFRSPDFNAKLKLEGRNVATNSQHTQGKALDIHIDELREDAVRDYLLSLKLGGVGYYGKILMVHMDFGPHRFWTSSEFVNNTKIGIFNKESDLKIQTENFYHGKDQLVVFAANLDLDLKQCRPQYFFRGKWHDLDNKYFEVTKQSQKWKLKIKNHSHFYGKYRLNYKGNKGWQNSNEFYIKRNLKA